MTACYDNCTVEVVQTNEGPEILWKRNYPIPDDESYDSLIFKEDTHKHLSPFERYIGCYDKEANGCDYLCSSCPYDIAWADVVDHMRKVIVKDTENK